MNQDEIDDMDDDYSETYSCGHLLNPKVDDPHFDDQQEAINAAMQGSRDDDVWAVWENTSGEIFWIVYQGMTYS